MSNTQSQGREKIQNVYLKWHNGHRPLSGFVKDIEALLDTLIADTDRESRLETAKDIRAIFDMSEFDPTGTMFDEHMMRRTPEEIAEGKMYNRDHAWAAMYTQGKIDEFIKALSTTTAGDSKTNHKGEQHE